MRLDQHLLRRQARACQKDSAIPASAIAGAIAFVIDVET
jgi:hypothetical protein